MPERVPKCPNCGANLTVGRHDLITVCAFCRATVKLDPDLVETARFREALAVWDAPETYTRSWTTVAGTHWIVGDRVATGESTDVYAATRARSPTECALLRIVRDPVDTPRLTRAAELLRRLQRSTVRGAHLAPRRLPEPIVAGEVTFGLGKGRFALLTRVPRRFPRTLGQLGTVPAVSSVWVLRRVLEILTYMHECGVVHGAVTPAHVLIEAGDHGARLVGFGNADEAGAPLRGRDSRYLALYPDLTLSTRGDVQMAARMIRATIGAAPAPYATLLADAATTGRWDAWTLREEVGRVAALAFGRPAFCPLIPR